MSTLHTILVQPFWLVSPPLHRRRRKCRPLNAGRIDARIIATAPDDAAGDG